jgi:O-antigen/teichoic acid export membrane protein
VEKSKLAKNSLWMILSRFGAQGLAVVFTILLARRLGIEGFGEYTFIAAIIFVANALTTFGTDMLLIRDIAAKGDLSRLPSALIVQLVLSILFITVVWMFGALTPNQNPEIVTALKIYCFALIPLAFFTVFTTALRGIQRMDIYSLLNLIVSVLQVGVVLLPNINIIRLSVLLLSVQIIAVVIASFVCVMTIPGFWQVWKFPSFHLFSFLKQAAPIAWLTLLGISYQRLNVYMLSTMSGAMETGIYSAASRAVEASKTMHLAVFAALYPAMAEGTSHLHDLLSKSHQPRVLQGERSPTTKSPIRLGDYFIRSRFEMTYFGFLFAGATIISLLLSILAKPLMILLYGNQFIPSSNVLQILAWMLIPFTVNTYFTLSFLASKRESIIGRSLIASLLGLLVLNLWWIPAKGPEGSAWAALVAECIQSTILLASAGLQVNVQGDGHEFSDLS